MYLYHGTTAKIGAIDFTKCRLRTDFGRGFYMTDKMGTARDWAVGKPSIEVRVPTVMRYEFNDAIFTDTSVDRQRFNAPDKAWLDFVKDNRRKESTLMVSKEPRHNYDVVSGPIADDKVVDVVIEYCNSIISAEEAITRIKALPSVIQVSIHTALALSYILSVSYSQRKSSKWSDWSF